MNEEIQEHITYLIALQAVETAREANNRVRSYNESARDALENVFDYTLGEEGRDRLNQLASLKSRHPDEWNAALSDVREGLSKHSEVGAVLSKLQTWWWTTVNEGSKA